MCGIAGVVDFRGSGQNDLVNACSRMKEALAHRGPDDSGVFHWQDGGMEVGLVHTRLSIIDLSPSGHQPMANEDGSVQVVFNGEIYNYQDLRPVLLQKGHRFISTSDTEVILHLYEERREQVLQDLRGMFAVALWDQRDRSLLLARDRLGIKPLYYQWDGSTLIFASEVRAIVQSGLSSGEIDPESVMLYLKTGSVPSPKTICRGILSLNPGHYLLLKDGRVEVREYWSLVECMREEPLALSRGDAVQMIRGQLLDGMKRHLVADVPVGIFLSGGVDSSALVSLAARVGHSKLKTVTAVFDDDPLDESRFAKAVAEKFGTDHVEVRITTDQIESMWDFFFDAMDQPTCDGFNTYLVAWAAKQAGLKVCLSGLGGDEMFGGYPSFRSVPRLYGLFHGLGPLARGVGRLASLFPGDKVGRLADMGRRVSLENVYLNTRAMFPDRRIAELLGRSVDDVDFSRHMVKGISRIRDPYRRVSTMELAVYMANQLLRDSDVFSMAHPVEIRVPFVDRVLLEHLVQVPSEYLAAGRYNKQFLIDAAGDLPEEVYSRPKMGFTLPFERWLKGQLKDVVAQSILACDMIHRPGAARVLGDYHAGRLHWSRIWTLYVLKRHVDALRMRQKSGRREENRPPLRDYCAARENAAGGEVVGGSTGASRTRAS